MNPKITEKRCGRPVYTYVRQSTNAQVLHHQESTERQYALRAMALELGWSEIGDPHARPGPGHDGTEMTRREDFGRSSRRTSDEYPRNSPTVQLFQMGRFLTRDRKAAFLVICLDFAPSRTPLRVEVRLGSEIASANTAALQNSAVRD